MCILGIFSSRTLFAWCTLWVGTPSGYGDKWHFLHGYPLELQAFPFLLTYLYIWGHSWPTACISENSCNSWHHPRAFHWRKSLKQQPVLKLEITTVYAQLWTKHYVSTELLWCWCKCLIMNRKGLLQESRLVFVLHMGSELDLGLDPCKLAGFIKGDRVGSIQYIIPGLEETWREAGGGVSRRQKHTYPGKGIELQRPEYYPKFTQQNEHFECIEASERMSSERMTKCISTAGTP